MNRPEIVGDLMTRVWPPQLHSSAALRCTAKRADDLLLYKSTLRISRAIQDSHSNWLNIRESGHFQIEHWRRDYSEVRPHSSLGDRTPREFTEEHLKRSITSTQ